MWQFLLIIGSFFIGVLVPVSGLKIGFLCLIILSLFWTIQRIWSFRPSAGRLARLGMLKLGYSLATSGLALVAVFSIISQFIELREIYSFTSPTAYLLILLGCGLLISVIGIILMIYVQRTHSSAMQQDEEHQ